jgi:hypothetical protein
MRQARSTDEVGSTARWASMEAGTRVLAVMSSSLVIVAPVGTPPGVPH